MFDVLFYFEGYDIETVDFTGLEEYWDYTFTVTASTIKGAATSLMTSVVKTKQARKWFTMFSSIFYLLKTYTKYT